MPAALLEVLGAKPPKLTSAQKLAFAKGIFAHLAIQTAYRVQHPGNLVVCERLPSLGIRKLVSIGRFAALITYGKKLVGKARARRVLRSLAPDQQDLLSVILHLLDVGTSGTTTKGISIKRFDIVDFGPLAARALSISPVQAYEIKPLSDVESGRAYIKRQTANLTQTFIALGATVAGALGVPGLDRLTAIPGTSWPPIPYVVPLGTNVLMFWLHEPGLIVYEWLTFKRQALAKVWASYSSIEEQVRQHIKPTIVYPSKEELLRGLTAVAAAVAIVGGALVLAEIGAAAGPIVALEPAIGRLAPMLRAFMATQVVSGAALGATPSTELASLAAIEAATEALDQGDVRPLPSEDVAGGVPTAPDPSDRLADAFAAEYASRILVSVGQGNELYDEHGIDAIRTVLRTWLRGYMSSFGTKEFLAQFGETEMSTAAARNIANTLITMSEQFSLGTEVAAMILDLMSLTAEDIAESLPLDSDDEGEAP